MLTLYHLYIFLNPLKNIISYNQSGYLRTKNLILTVVLYLKNIMKLLEKAIQQYFLFQL
jgi:hypothetical protein